jgi:hypothetical protein
MLIEKELIDFPSIFELSSIYMAFTDLPESGIAPFSEGDIADYIEQKKFEVRSFQAKEVENEFYEFRGKLERQGFGREIIGEELARFAREFHLKRIAFLAFDFPPDPIQLLSVGTIKDGVHRVIAAKFLGLNTIQCIIVSGGK